uniref:Envelope-like protein n=1 Tax=Cucumis melo TaxID=3656 RepID=A0A9I9DKH3_CUCME
MVNTRKGTYAAKSSKDVLETQILKTSMHGVSIGGLRFKSTPLQRPYRLLLEKSQAHVFDRLYEPVQDDVDSRNPATNTEHAPGPSLYSSPVRSSIPKNTTTSGPHNDSAPAFADESIATEGRTDVHNGEDEVEPANIGDHTGEISIDDNNNPAAQPETHAFLEESRPTKKKFQ